VVDIERQLWSAMRIKGHVEFAAQFESHMAAPERAAMPPGARRDYLARLLEVAGHGALAEALRLFTRDAHAAPAAAMTAAAAAAAAVAASSGGVKTGPVPQRP
jgi:hypothetical protein